MSSRFVQSGIASIWETGHADKTAWVKHLVAHPDEMVAAHRTLPLGTKVRVHHTDARGHDHSVVVQIVDRGPYVAGRIIDLMKAPANAIGITDEMGVGRVTIEEVA